MKEWIDDSVFTCRDALFAQKPSCRLQALIDISVSSDSVACQMLMMTDSGMT